jgi:hypothetical protein
MIQLANTLGACNGKTLTMPRFFFNVVVGSAIMIDEDGTELPTVEAARDEALKDARGMMGDAVRQGQDISARKIEICDGAGVVLEVVSFADAITIHD